MLVSEWSCVGIGSVCGVSSLSSLMVVASSVSWDTTQSSDLQAVSAELFSCTVGMLPWTVARLWKWPFSAKDSNLSESLDGVYSSSGCSVLCASSFLGEPSTITRKDFHGVFLSCIYKSNTKQKSQRVSEQVHLLKQQSLFNLVSTVAKYPFTNGQVPTTTVTVKERLSQIVPLEPWASVLFHTECTPCRENLKRKDPLSSMTTLWDDGWHFWLSRVTCTWGPAICHSEVTLLLTEVCRRRVDLSVNVRPHALHMNGFSPVWMRWWRWRALSWVNCFPHWSQQ